MISLLLFTLISEIIALRQGNDRPGLKAACDLLSEAEGLCHRPQNKKKNPGFCDLPNVKNNRHYRELCGPAATETLPLHLDQNPTPPKPHKKQEPVTLNPTYWTTFQYIIQNPLPQLIFVLFFFFVGARLYELTKSRKTPIILEKLKKDEKQQNNETKLKKGKNEDVKGAEPQKTGLRGKVETKVEMKGTEAEKKTSRGRNLLVESNPQSELIQEKPFQPVPSNKKATKNKAGTPQSAQNDKAVYNSYSVLAPKPKSPKVTKTNMIVTREPIIEKAVDQVEGQVSFVQVSDRIQIVHSNAESPNNAVVTTELTDSQHLRAETQRLTFLYEAYKDKKDRLKTYSIGFMCVSWLVTVRHCSPNYIHETLESLAENSKYFIEAAFHLLGSFYTKIQVSSTKESPFTVLSLFTGSHSVQEIGNTMLSELSTRILVPALAMLICIVFLLFFFFKHDRVIYFLVFVFTVTRESTIPLAGISFFFMQWIDELVVDVDWSLWRNKYMLISCAIGAGAIIGYMQAHELYDAFSFQ